MKIPLLPESEESRLAALRAYDILDSLPEKLYDNITQLASQICGTPISLVSLIDERRQWFKSSVGLDATETPREISFCGHAILQRGVFQVPNSLQDPRFADNPLVVDGPRVIFYAGAPLKTPSGEQIGTLCVIDHKPRELNEGQIRSLESLADQVVALLELRIAVNAAEKASQTKSEFLANMSHEIRTPLAAMIGFANLLQEPRLDGQERIAFAGTIARNGKALTQIIDDILDLAKVEAGKVEIENVAFDFPAVVEEIAGMFRERVEAKRIYLRTSVSPQVPRMLQSDPTRVRQILINLIGNAVKFTENGGVALTVHAPVLSADGSLQILMDIQDTGIGIDPQKREVLFKPFVQADNSTTRRFGGTGLGLSLSKRLAGLLGGDVVLEASEVNRGCTFRASFISRPVSSAVEMFAEHSKLPPIRRPLEGVRILLADDSEDNLFIGNHLLSKFGAVVETADTGLDACAKARGSRFNVILMDIQMPQMDGIEATKTLRSEGFEVPIIALTAHGMAEAKLQTKDAGFSAHVVKPFDRELLLATIQAHLT